MLHYEKAKIFIYDIGTLIKKIINITLFTTDNVLV